MASSGNKAISDLSFPFKDYVLALPGWYPTWLDPLPGDFNQRHIKAASIYTPQIVLYIGKDTTGTLRKTEFKTVQASERLVELMVVYPQLRYKWFDALYSNLYFFILLNKYSNLIKKQWGKPKLLHSYIVMRGGLAGWLLGMKWKLPFILSENWTIYYPADPGYLPTRNFFFRWLVERVFKNVHTFLPVTNNLKERAAALLGEVTSVVIPNVVETNTFNYKQLFLPHTPFRFIHISTMIYQKNPEGLLRTFKKFNQEHPATFLQLVGPYPQEVFDYAYKLGLNETNIRFEGPVSYSRVSELIKGADALVLFSRYENLPCVILEAFCCGLPVISTAVGGIAEVIDKDNGILLPSGDEAKLLQAFKQMYTNYSSYNNKAIADASVSRYSYEAVGKKINEVYIETTRPNS